MLCIGKLFSQSFDQYISHNKLSFKGNNDSIVLKEFLNYNYYFLGETHGITRIDSIRHCFVDFLIIRKRIDYLFLEEGVNSYVDFENFSNRPKEKKCCSDFIWDMSYYSKVLKGINDYNLGNKKITVLPIDVFHSLNHYRGYDITRITDNKRPLPNTIYNDVKYIRNVSKKKREKRFKLFADSFQVHKDLYKEYFGADYFKIEKNVNAFIINYNTIRVNPDSVLNSARENFMFQNILSEINDSSTFISLNGLNHVTLEGENGPITDRHGWEPLAYLFEKNIPNKKTCSVFIMNRKEDDVGDYSFKEEKDGLLKNIPDGQIALVALRAKNSPFKKMSQVFTYILIY